MLARTFCVRVGRFSPGLRDTSEARHPRGAPPGRFYARPRARRSRLAHILGSVLFLGAPLAPVRSLDEEAGVRARAARSRSRPLQVGPILSLPGGMHDPPLSPPEAGAPLARSRNLTRTSLIEQPPPQKRQHVRDLRRGHLVGPGAVAEGRVDAGRAQGLVGRRAPRRQNEVVA